MRGETMKKYLRVGDLREFLNDCYLEYEAMIKLLNL